MDSILNKSNAIVANVIEGRLMFHNKELLESTLPGKLVTIFTLADVFMIFVILAAVAWIKDEKVDVERHPVFLPVRPPRGFRLYAVLLETGQSPAGGTSSKVFLRICGKLTKTAGFSLVCSNGQRANGSKRLFGSQNKDIFILSVPHYLGGITSFEVMTNRRGDSPPWFLRSIRVMSLDNRKCWKSNVGAWLRGDMKPYSIKATLIGALSTKEYFLKVFLQNYNWTFAWFRPLGSSFSCLQRCAVHWTSMGIALGISHYMLYDAGSLINITKKDIITPSFTTAEIAQAAFLSTAAGVFIGSIFRVLARYAAGGTKWARVDDKDDFSHLMDDGSLEFALGSVVKKGEDPNQDCLGQLKLTPEQIKAIKHITECGVSDCSLKAQINDPECKPTKDCCFATEGRHKRSTVPPKRSTKRSTVTEKKKSAFVKDSDSSKSDDDDDDHDSENMLSTTDASLQQGRMTTGSSRSEESIDWRHIPMEADKRGYRQDIEEEMRDVWQEDEEDRNKQTDPGLQKKLNRLRFSRKYKKSKSKISRNSKKSRKSGKAPKPSRGITKKSTKKFSFFKRLKSTTNDVPMVSARSVTSEISLGFLADELNEEKRFSVGNDEYDSVSDPESDQEIVTKSARTDSEINLARRPSYIYEMAPRWHDPQHVYTQAPEGSEEHHKLVRERYDFFESKAVCCYKAGPMTGLDSAIAEYKEEEHRAPNGHVILPHEGSANLLAGFGALVGLSAVGFAVYQRLNLPNADSVIYLYAVISILLLHLFVFSPLDAVVWALISTWVRRRRILEMRESNARAIEYKRHSNFVG